MQCFFLSRIFTIHFKSHNRHQNAQLGFNEPLPQSANQHQIQNSNQMQLCVYELTHIRKRVERDRDRNREKRQKSPRIISISTHNPICFSRVCHLMPRRLRHVQIVFWYGTVHAFYSSLILHGKSFMFAYNFGWILAKNTKIILPLCMCQGWALLDRKMDSIIFNILIICVSGSK